LFTRKGAWCSSDISRAFHSAYVAVDANCDGQVRTRLDWLDGAVKVLDDPCGACCKPEGGWAAQSCYCKKVHRVPERRRLSLSFW
jgi:hypothetical protein